MSDVGQFHFDVLVSGFQLSAAVAIWLSRTEHRKLRRACAALIAANGMLSAMTALRFFGESRTAAGIQAAADDATIGLLFLVAGAVVAEIRGESRGLTFPLSLIAVGFAAFGAASVAAGGALAAVRAEMVGVVTPLAYSLVIIALFRAAGSSGSWQTRWLLGAFVLRAGYFVVHFGEVEISPSQVAMLILVLTLSSCALLSLRANSGDDRRAAFFVFGAAGIAIGVAAAIGRLDDPETNFLTLAVGRPALMLIGLTAPGFARGFFRASLLAVASYVGTVFACRPMGFLPVDGALPQSLVAGSVAGIALGIRSAGYPPPRVPGTEAAPDRPSGPTLVADAALPDSERLLHLLSEADRGQGLSRREIAAALGIAARNVPRVVDAANRLEGVPPGVDLVRVWFARGRGNQVQHQYGLTEEGRNRVGTRGPANVSPIVKRERLDKKS